MQKIPNISGLIVETCGHALIDGRVMRRKNLVLVRRKIHWSAGWTFWNHQDGQVCEWAHVQGLDAHLLHIKVSPTHMVNVTSAYS